MADVGNGCNWFEERRSRHRDRGDAFFRTTLVDCAVNFAASVDIAWSPVIVADIVLVVVGYRQ